MPYQTIIVAAIVPAFMHFFGVFMQVHFEAKRCGLRGLTDEEMPQLRESLRQRWPTLIPLVLLIGILVSGRTPYLAAFTGITLVRHRRADHRRRRQHGARNWALLVALHAVLLVLVASAASRAKRAASASSPLPRWPRRSCCAALRRRGSHRLGTIWSRRSRPAPSTRSRSARPRPRSAS